jgi:predicted ATP-dependent endonuclease of OLD family
MKLKKVKIEDFKSIKSLEVNIHDLTCLVGQNESGKSNILEAIRYLDFNRYKLSSDLLNKNSEKYETGGFPSVSGWFYFEDKDENEWQLFYKKVMSLEGKTVDLSGLLGFYIVVKSDQIENIEVSFIYRDKNRSIGSLISRSLITAVKQSIMDEFVPLIELYTNDDLELNPISNEQIHEKSTAHTAFFKLLSIGGISDINILLGDPDKAYDKIQYAQEKITKLFLEFYKQDPNLKIEIGSIAGTWLIKFRDSTNRTYSLKERSVGFRYFFAFFINKYFAIANSETELIYLLDEPGVSLHPKGAKDLLELFNEITATDQIIYTTHNPFLTCKNTPDKLILVKKNGEQGSIIHNKPYANKYEVLRKELGLLLNDSFLVGECNIVVEGVSDKFVLHHIIDEIEDFEHLKWINIFSADSSSEILPSVRYLKSLNLIGVVLLDDDNAAKNEITKPKFKELIIDNQNWDFITVTGKHGESYTQKTLEDIFEQSHYIEAYNTYYTEEYDNLSPIKPFTNLILQEVVVPVLDIIKIHHKEYFGTDQINKVGVFRKLFELHPYEKEKAVYKNIVDLIKAIDKSIRNLK